MAKRNAKNSWTPLQIITHLGALFPLVWLAWDFWQGQTALLINPFQEATFRTGKAAIILLMLSLACTPVNTLFGFKQVLPLRKPLGNYAFMYAAIHFLIFIVDNGLVSNSLNLWAVYEATFEKRYALVGFAAFVILLALALTSNQWSMRTLRKNWKRLHRFVYTAGVLAVIHFIWLVKSDIREPLIYGVLLTIMLVLRIPAVRKWVVNTRQNLTRGRQAAASSS
ncbi:MAG: sulfoxide reductase heme-binding subunit YedZ [Anaerolineaceae bacterium]|nr:sulfoxide reductase heme-binding subunit YedZ [Anaerolineaceae bacterium]MCB9100488.1 sulfoxide reductase heme-binding subunit YedZ [Anaerolineales bacterium]